MYLKVFFAAYLMPVTDTTLYTFVSFKRLKSQLPTDKATTDV